MSQVLDRGKSYRTHDETMYTFTLNISHLTDKEESDFLCN